MAHECHSRSNMCFARSGLADPSPRTVCHTHELSAENLEWGGVGELLALII